MILDGYRSIERYNDAIPIIAQRVSESHNSVCDSTSPAWFLMTIFCHTTSGNRIACFLPGVSHFWESSCAQCGYMYIVYMCISWVHTDSIKVSFISGPSVFHHSAIVVLMLSEANIGLVAFSTFSQHECIFSFCSFIVRVDCSTKSFKNKSSFMSLFVIKVYWVGKRVNLDKSSISVATVAAYTLVQIFALLNVPPPPPSPYCQ